jgi:hypothetical protein
VSDSTIVLSPAKAKELGLRKGDAVALVGRRRRAAYAKVTIDKQNNVKCVVSANFAKNLRLRNGDKLKVVPLVGETPKDTERSGDMVLLQVSTPPKATTVTLAPIEDSLKALQNSEGGDDIPEEELTARFVAPYVEEKGGMVKVGHVLALSDDNGKKLEFMVTEIELEGDKDKIEETEGAQQIQWLGRTPFIQ